MSYQENSKDLRTEGSWFFEKTYELSGNSLKKRGCLFLFSAFIICSTCLDARSEDKPLKQVSFVTLWQPQAQFAGFFVAREKGINKKYGLDVTIIDGGPDNAPARLLEDKKADFGLLWLSTGIEKRAQGAKLVNIAQVVQKSGLMLVARKSSGISSPLDMKGKKVGLWNADFEIQPRALFKKYNLDVKVIPQTYSVNLFLRGGVDVASAMWYNEYHIILNSGVDPEELTTFFFYDHGLNSPEDGIYAMEDKVKNDPDTCRAFVRASLEGWRYAFEHPDEAVDIVLKYMEKKHVQANRVHQQWMLSGIKDLTLAGGTYAGMGKLSSNDFVSVTAVLKENGLIQDVPAFETFHKRFQTDD